MKRKNKTSYEQGRGSEYWAMLFLFFKGYRILTRRFVFGRGTNAGEIDLIAYKKQTIVFVEVKRRKTYDEAAYAISTKQKQRIIKAAGAYLKYHPQYQQMNMRFDALLLYSSHLPVHIQNAWQS